MGLRRAFGFVGISLVLATLACDAGEFAREASEGVTVWYVATDGNDGNRCDRASEACRTVQEAINRADERDLILVQPGLYLLDRGIEIRSKTSLTILGAGRSNTFLQREGEGDPLTVADSIDITVSDLTLSGGAGSQPDHVVRIAGCSIVVLEDLTVQGGNTTIKVEELSCPPGEWEVVVRRVLVVGATAFYGIDSAANTRIESSTIRESLGSGGISNTGVMVVTHSTVDRNLADLYEGFGIFNGGDGHLTVTSSTLSRNAGFVGAGIFNNGFAQVQNSTISGNWSGQWEGIYPEEPEWIPGPFGGYGIENHGTLYLTHVTIADNEGIGLKSDGEHASVFAANTLIADNDFADCDITGGEPLSVGLNLDSDLTCFPRLPDTASRRLPRVALGSLADNGGPTETHALDPGSAGVDEARGLCPTVDQRGVDRPRGEACDVGAFEVEDPSIRAASLQVTIEPTFVVTPTGGKPPTVREDALCKKGPGPGYETVSAVLAGTVVEILGLGVEGGWWVIDNPRFPGVPCWLPEDLVDVDPSFDVTGLRRFPIPPLATATPTAVLGCWIQGPNDPQPVCTVPCPASPKPGGTCLP